MRPLPAIARWLCRWVLVCTCTVGCTAGTVEAMLEQTFLYFPDRHLSWHPGRAGLDFEDVSFPAEDGTRLHGWYVPGEGGAPLLIFFHGNAGNISDRVGNLAHLHNLGLNVFIFDYRGYGKSEGKPTEQGTYADARGALAWARERGFAPERMVYFGRSLGASVAVQLAVETRPGGVILETPFTSIRDMGRLHYPLLYLLLGWVLDARYDSIGKMGSIEAPLLVIQGDRDSIVPEHMAKGLFEAANEPKRYYLIPGAGHNDTYVVGGAEYWKEWQRFLEEHFPY